MRKMISWTQIVRENQCRVFTGVCDHVCCVEVEKKYSFWWWEAEFFVNFTGAAQPLNCQHWQPNDQKQNSVLKRILPKL